MKTSCPHCGQHYSVENSLLNEIVSCEKCKQEFVVEFAEERSEKKTKKEYRIIVMEDVRLLEIELNKLAVMGYHPVTMSTIFLGETAGSFGGLGASVRREGVAIILEREQPVLD